MLCDTCSKQTDLDELDENSGICNDCYNEEHNIIIETDQQYLDRIEFIRTLSDCEVELYITDCEGQA